jgi:hypothetical protein
MSRSIGLRAAVPLLAASALLLATAGGVLAKCEHDPDACEGVSATFDPGGGTLSAGGSETVGVWILENEQPYAASRVELVFNRVADATVVRVDARPTSRAGRWQAIVDLPEGGTWTVAAEVQGPNYAGSFALDTFQVSPATAAAASSTSAATIVAPQQLVPWIVALALAAGLLGAVLLARRQIPTAQRG